MRILVLADYYLPGFRSGGPVRTLSNFADRLGDVFQLTVITRDRDMGDVVAYPNVIWGAPQSVGKAEVIYLRATALLPIAFVRILQNTPHDVLYLNSVFSPWFGILPLVLRRMGVGARRPIVLAPRGELSKAAMAIKSLKKRVYLVAAKASAVFTDIVWQASSELERDDIHRLIGQSAKVRIAPDVPMMWKVDGTPLRSPKSVGLVRVCFLSRIDRMKNLDFALRVVASMRDRIDFDIYGPVDDSSYWEQCLLLSERLPPNVCVQYFGEVPHAQVAATISKYDIFFLPSRGENFGHVILEALGVGSPVLISDRTPWNHLASRGAGWALPLDDEESFRSVLRQVAKWDQNEWLAWSVRAASFARSQMEASETIDRNRDLFVSLER